MSGGLDILALKEDDVTKMLAASTHLGSENCDFQMSQYVFKRKSDGGNIINLRKTWEKLLFAARAIVAVENPADVCVISARPYCQRAILKFAAHTGGTAVAGRFTPGTFTNQIQAAFREPRLLVVSDPRLDHQPVTEASYVNIPVIAFCNTDSPLKYVDIAIPCNNNSHHSTGLMWWLLAREVLRLRGSISRESPWEVMPDLYFYRAPDEVEKEDLAQLDKSKAEAEFGGGAPPGVAPVGGGDTFHQVAPDTDWSADLTPVPAAPVPAVPPAAGGAPAAPVAPAAGSAATTFGAPMEEWSQPKPDEWSSGGGQDSWGGGQESWA